MGIIRVILRNQLAQGKILCAFFYGDAVWEKVNVDFPEQAALDYFSSY